MLDSQSVVFREIFSQGQATHGVLWQSPRDHYCGTARRDPGQRVDMADRGAKPNRGRCSYHPCPPETLKKMSDKAKTPGRPKRHTPNHALPVAHTEQLIIVCACLIQDVWPEAAEGFGLFEMATNFFKAA